MYKVLQLVLKRSQGVSTSFFKWSGRWPRVLKWRPTTGKPKGKSSDHPTVNFASSRHFRLRVRCPCSIQLIAVIGTPWRERHLYGAVGMTICIVLIELRRRACTPLLITAARLPCVPYTSQSECEQLRRIQ